MEIIYFSGGFFKLWIHFLLDRFCRIWILSSIRLRSILHRLQRIGCAFNSSFTGLLGCLSTRTSPWHNQKQQINRREQELKAETIFGKTAWEINKTGDKCHFHCSILWTGDLGIWSSTYYDFSGSILNQILGQKSAGNDWWKKNEKTASYHPHNQLHLTRQYWD